MWQAPGTLQSEAWWDQIAPHLGFCSWPGQLKGKRQPTLMDGTWGLGVPLFWLQTVALLLNQVEDVGQMPRPFEGQVAGVGWAQTIIPPGVPCG